MKRISLIALLLMPLMLLGQSFDNMRRTTTATNTDLILVQTNSAGAAGNKFTAAMELGNLLEVFKGFTNWTGGGGSGGVSTDPSQFTTNGTTLVLPSGVAITNPVVAAIGSSPVISTRGGNTRGAGAVDLQYGRQAATNVASGRVSVISGGTNNEASGLAAVVLGGENNKARGDYSGILWGSGNRAGTTTGDQYAASGGFDNFAYAIASLVMGGTDNWNSNAYGTIVGGALNVMHGGSAGAIIGSSQSDAFGDYNFIGGGTANVTSNNYSGALGSYNRSVADYGWTLGAYLTNSKIGQVMIGYTTPNALTIASNGAVNVAGNQTNAGSWLKLSGANDPTIEIKSIVLPQTLFINSQGMGTRNGGGQPYLTFSPEGSVVAELTTTNFRPANGVSGGLGQDDRQWTSANIATVKSSSIPTNSLVYSGGQSNLSAATVSTGLSFSGGVLSVVTYLANLIGTGAITNLVDAQTNWPSGSFSLINRTNSGNAAIKGVSAGYGMAGTNNATNVVLAVDAAVIPSHSQLVTVSNFVAAVSNLVNTKQVGSLVLSNAAGTGLITNLFSLTQSNANAKPLVVGVGTAAGATNQTGQIRGLEAGSNITLSENGSNLVITATGGSASTNWVTAAAGSLTVTNYAQIGQLDVTSNAFVNSAIVSNSFKVSGIQTNAGKVRLFDDIIQLTPSGVAYFYSVISSTLTATNIVYPAQPLTVAGTNLIADGSLTSTYTNAIRSSGTTNIVFTNLVDGSAVTVDLWVTNGTPVQLCTAPGVVIPDPWYLPGSAVNINSNGFSRVIVRRWGGFTNVQVFTPEYTLALGPAQSITTNDATRVITFLLSSVLTNLAGTVANNVTNENSAALQINNGTLTLSPGPLSNVVASGHSAPYIAINTNSGTLNNITNLIARTPSIVVSNDSTGIASLHVNRQGVYRTIYVDAAAMVSNITAGATFSTEESQGAMVTTNKMIDSYVFDGSTSNAVQFKLAMPLEWDLSTVKVKLWTWSTNNVATTTNVFGVAAVAIKDSTVITNVTWGTEQTITNAVSSDGGKAHLTAATPALTVGNSPAAAGNLVLFRVRRLPGNANDNDGGQQKLLGAWIQYKEQEAEVASW